MLVLSRAVIVLACVALAHGAVAYRVKLSGRIITVPAEQYVAGVLAGEASVFKTDEALKAMAVAARTYAAYTQSRHQSEGYDFCSTTHCQRFDLGGTDTHLRNIAAATAGQLLWFQGKPAFGLYSRDCGGITEKDDNFPYLRVKTDPYCTRNTGLRWTWTVDPRQIVGALRAVGLKTPDPLVHITVLDRSSSNRSQTIALDGTPISESSFRFAIGRILGWNLIKSDRYEVQSTGDRFVFRGTGQGHGVGLCQDGADEMGREGFDYKKILAFYYPGTVIGRLGSGLAWTRLGGENVALYTTNPQADNRLLPLGERSLRSAEARLHLTMNAPVDIYVYPDLATFRNATGEPGWVGARSKGNRIDLQPERVLASRGVLVETLKHEFFHVVIEGAATPGLPLWFREGLVAFLTAPAQVGAPPTGIVADNQIRQKDDEQTARVAYRQSAERVGLLISRYGESTVFSWLTRGLPLDVKNASVSDDAINNR